MSKVMPMTNGRQMESDPHSTSEHEAYEVLGDVFERGDATSVGIALHVPNQHIFEMLANVRRNPVEATAIVVEQLRRNGNRRADEPFLWLAWRLGYVAHRVETNAADAGLLAAFLKETSDVIAAHGVMQRAREEAERDGVITIAERRQSIAHRRELALQLSEVVERAMAYRQEELNRAAEEEALLTRRIS